MKRTMEYDVVVMGSGVSGMGAAYKLANAGGLKVAVFEKYPAQGGAVSNCPMVFAPHRTHRKRKKVPMRLCQEHPITVPIWVL